MQGPCLDLSHRENKFALSAPLWFHKPELPPIIGLSRKSSWVRLQLRLPVLGQEIPEDLEGGTEGGQNSGWKLSWDAMPFSPFSPGELIADACRSAVTTIPG